MRAEVANWLDQLIQVSAQAGIIQKNDAEIMRAELSKDVAASPSDLRSAGWIVVMHTDCGANGVAWSVRKGDVNIRAHGSSDAEALNSARAQISNL